MWGRDCVKKNDLRHFCWAAHNRVSFNHFSDRALRQSFLSYSTVHTLEKKNLMMIN